jgi:hypothetical protein
MLRAGEACRRFSDHELPQRDRAMPDLILPRALSIFSIIFGLSPVVAKAMASLTSPRASRALALLVGLGIGQGLAGGMKTGERLFGGLGSLQMLDGLSHARLVVRTDAMH